MPRHKLTKRQREVIATLCAAPGRRLARRTTWRDPLRERGHYLILERTGASLTGVHATAPTIVEALTSARLLTESLEPTSEALRAYGPARRP